MNSTTPCALCGTTTAHRIVGRVGCVCVDCLGEAAKQAIAKQHVPKSITVTASDLCLLCGDEITSGNLAASRAPYKLCHGCLLTALESASDLPEGTQFIQVNF
jgi:hypothetical protein